MVWLSSRNLRLKNCSKKLGPKFVGPFKVVQIVNSAVLRLDIHSSWEMNSVFQVPLLKKVDTPDKVAMPSAPPIDEDCEFEISRILDSRWHRGGLQYLVSWKGFGPEDKCWVCLESGYIEGLSTALQNAVDKPLMAVAKAYIRKSSIMGMSKEISQDIRKRIVDLHKFGSYLSTISRYLKVPCSSVEAIIR
ncbi:unnamed protein product [Ranitomeya imitator]|uniref:Chromo domain-containing protein n=1 Tax=Ranitomeya imitator TaxID=111125 RepID=A0ABN9MGZ7_9NEOB|nr:unnamed protein product [Ranitomeya imitator]